MTTATSPADDAAATFRAAIPPMLSFVSGFVDTTGFLGLSGLLTSQVTGAFVAGGAAFVQRDPGLTTKLLAMPMFMAGACLLTLAVAIFRQRGINPMPYALAMVSLLIATFLVIAVNGHPFPAADAPSALAAAIIAFLAMGAESALVRVLFKGSLPANFMTGNVTQVAVESTDLVLARLGQIGRAHV